MCNKLAERIPERNCERVIAVPVDAGISHCHGKEADECVPDGTNPPGFRIIFRHNHHSGKPRGHMAGGIRIVVRDVPVILKLVREQSPLAAG